MLFERRASWNQHSMHRAVKQAYLLQGEVGSKSSIVSLRKPSFQEVPCTVPALDQEIGGDQGAVKLQKQRTLVMELSQGRSQESEEGEQKLDITIIHSPSTVLDFVTCVLLQRIKIQ